MEVKLHNPEVVKDAIFIMYDACRMCKGKELKPHEEYDAQKATEVVKKALNAGHWSLAEHVNFRFEIRGITRACANQLTRYRHASYSQESLRSVEIGKEVTIQELKDYLTYEDDPDMVEVYDKVNNMLDKHFDIPYSPTNYSGFDVNQMIEILIYYKKKIEDGESPESARAILPLCTKTNLLMTVNLRELVHICHERLCTKAQKEIRELVNLMKSAISEQSQEFDRYLVPKCEYMGRCTEEQPCLRLEEKE